MGFSRIWHMSKIQVRRSPVALIAAIRPCHSLRARRPRGDAGRLERDRAAIRTSSSRSSKTRRTFPAATRRGSRSPASRSRGRRRAAVRRRRVLPIGAQSSLTGGATPMGDLLLSTSRLNRILEIGADCGPRRSRRDAASTRRRAGARRPVLSAVADLHRRVRRRHRRDQCRRRRDVQVRHDARLGARAHRRAAGRRRPRHRARRDHRRSRTALRDRAADRTVRLECRATACRRCRRCRPDTSRRRGWI